MKDQYLVCIQKRYQEKEGIYYNLRKLLYGLNSGMYYISLEDAKRDLDEYIKKQSRGARTETTHIGGGIGISLEIDESDAVRTFEI